MPTLPAQARASWPPEGHGCSDGPFASPARAAHACTLIICARFCSQEEPEEKENTANGDVAAERDVVPRRLGLSARDDSTRGAPGRPPSAHPVRPLPAQPALGRACPRLAATTRFRALTSPACFPCADEAGSKRASEGDAPIGETKRVKRDQVAEIIAAADTANAAAAEAAISELKTSEPPPDFRKKRVPELRKELVALGLNDKGRKDELVERLTNHFLEQQAAAAAAAAAAEPAPVAEAEAEAAEPATSAAEEAPSEAEVEEAEAGGAAEPAEEEAKAEPEPMETVEEAEEPAAEEEQADAEVEAAPVAAAPSALSPLVEEAETSPSSEPAVAEPAAAQGRRGSIPRAVRSKPAAVPSPIAESESTEEEEEAAAPAEQEEPAAELSHSAAEEQGEEETEEAAEKQEEAAADAAAEAGAEAEAEGEGELVDDGWSGTRLVRLRRASP